MPAHYPPPDHGGRHLRGLRFLFSARTERKATEPASHTLTPHPSRHVRPARKSAAPPPAATPEKPPPCIPPAASPHHSSPRLPAPLPRQAQKKRPPRRNRHPSSASSTLHTRAIRIPLRAGWEKAPSSYHAFHVRAARESAAPHLSPTPLRTRPRRGRAPEPAPHIRIRSTRASSRPGKHKKNATLAGTATLHPHSQHPAPLSAVPRQPKNRRPPPPAATPEKTSPCIPPAASPRHSSPSLPAPPRATPRRAGTRAAPPRAPSPAGTKKSGSPLKAAALRSNRRAISCP